MSRTPATAVRVPGDDAGCVSTDTAMVVPSHDRTIIGAQERQDAVPLSQEFRRAGDSQAGAVAARAIPALRLQRAA
jgi:hypothetical protein